MSRESAPSPGRIVSMDQFRGYTVAGMFLVNFLGGYAAIHEVMKHHNGHPYFSYADTIMPSFMFAAGFSFRLTALRRLAQIGPAAAYRRFVDSQPRPGSRLGHHVQLRFARSSTGPRCPRTGSGSSSAS